MSVRSDSAVCKHCGLVELAAKMVRIEEGEYVYLCQGCAVAQRGADVSADASGAIKQRSKGSP